MMRAETEILNYLEMMKDSLVKKDTILDAVIVLTKKQEAILNSESFDAEAFEDAIDRKSPLIDEINRLDEGFNLIYNRVIEKVKESPHLYREKIENMQSLIKLLVDKGVEIENREGRNKIKFDTVAARGKDKIRKYNLSSSAVTKYYSNMSGNNKGGNYFLDSKK